MIMEKIHLNPPLLEDIIMILTQIIMIIPGVLVEEMVMSIHQEIQRQDQVEDRLSQCHQCTTDSNGA